MNSKRLLKLFILLVLLSSCNSIKSTSKQHSDPDKLYESSWVLESWKTDAKEREIKSMEKISLNFNKENMQVSGNDGCNQFFGSFEIQGDRIRIGPTGGTKKYCGEESAVDERAFTGLLQEELNYRFKEGKLHLITNKDELIFNPNE